MQGLVLWLRAQLDEDERIAREAAGKYESGGRWWEDGRFGNDGTVGDERGSVVVYRTGVGRQHPKHIAAHDPARVLREIDAQRAIVDQYAEVAANDVDEVEYAHGWANALGAAVRLLALPYADTPGYREEWRP